MGRRVSIFCLAVTVLVTLSTTVVVGIAVLSDYWEIVQYSSDTISEVRRKKKVKFEVLFGGALGKVYHSCLQLLSPAESGSSSSSSASTGSHQVEVLFGGKVVVIKRSDNGSLEELLVQMHGGLWTLCLDLTGTNYLQAAQQPALGPRRDDSGCVSKSHDGWEGQNAWQWMLHGGSHSV